MERERQAADPPAPKYNQLKWDQHEAVRRGRDRHWCEHDFDLMQPMLTGLVISRVPQA